MGQSNILRAKNNTGSTLVAGTVVYISGYDDDNQIPYIAAASNNDATKMPAVGIVREDIVHGSYDVVKISGPINSIDTSDTSINAAVYVGQNGNVTFTEPAVYNSSLITQQLGTVLNADVYPIGVIQLFHLEQKTRVRHIELLDVEEDRVHTQYSLVDGARAFTGTISGVTPTSDAHLATKGYIDSLLNADCISIYRSTDSDAISTEYNPFGTDNGGTVVVKANNGIIFNSSTGIITVPTTGIYEISAVLNIEQSSTGTLSTFEITQNSVAIWSATTYIHTSINPIERTAQVILDLTALDDIEFRINSFSTSTLTSHIGCTMNIKQVI